MYNSIGSEPRCAGTVQILAMLGYCREFFFFFFCVLRPQEHFLAKKNFHLNIPPPPPARPRPVFRTLTPILVQ